MGALWAEKVRSDDKSAGPCVRGRAVVRACVPALAAARGGGAARVRPEGGAREKSQ